MSEEPHFHPIQVYYEDTDHSGLVYHANYLKFFERAREHFLGIDKLLELQNEGGQGFVVYKVEVTYKQGAVFGQKLWVRTVAHIDTEYRLILKQDIVKEQKRGVMVKGELHIVCVDGEKNLVPLPEFVVERFGEPT